MTDSQNRVYGGRYEIKHKIARGGMADVYYAQDKLLDRPVALKVLFAELSVDPSFVERFRREAQSAARLSHPNIVSVYDWGEDSNTYFIVMELVEGKSLSVELRDKEKLSADRAALIGSEVASALAFAHRNGVVHRDVKPGNVLIDERGTVKVTDFGIARARNTTENLTQTGAVMGTATYFSPEQAQGMSVDQRSDVYSLGVVLYEMVAGKPPFTGDNPVTIAYKHVRETPPALRSIVPSVPGDFEKIVNHALAKSPASRYASADDLRADLERFRQGQAVAATAVAAADPTMANAGAPTAMQTAAQRGYGDATRAVPVTGANRYDEPEKEKSLAKPLMILVALLAAIGIGALILFNNDFGDDDAVPTAVPNVVGSSEDQARQTLEDAGFDVDVSTDNSDTAPEGTVISQDPAGNATVPSGSTIDLIVSEGPEEVQVPRVTNQSLSDAQSTLENAGLSYSVSRESSNSVDEGDVISQDPSSGRSVARGTTVNLVVSTGESQVQVPSVSGYTFEGAQSALREAGLNPQLGSGSRDGTVQSTDPSAGTSVDEGTTVTIRMSEEQESTTTTSTTSPGNGNGNGNGNGGGNGNALSLFGQRQDD
jgi:eukaryotic-like serine/threonine-protein kinase